MGNGKTKYFECRVEFVTGQTSTGRDKTRKEYILVDAQTVTESEAKITTHLNNVAPNTDWTITQSKESKIQEVVE